MKIQTMGSWDKKKMRWKYKWIGIKVQNFVIRTENKIKVQINEIKVQNDSI